MKLDARKAAIVATSVYIDGVLSADTAEITTPEIVHKTMEMEAMGTIEVPILGQLDSMKLGIKTAGNDPLMMKLGQPGSHTVVVNAVQQVVGVNGKNLVELIKVTASGFGTKVPSRGYKTGEQSESEYEVSCTAYKESVDGIVIVDINKLAGKCQIMGKDFGMDIMSLL
jgi:P2 family phage contractile tail tube protein